MKVGDTVVGINFKNLPLNGVKGKIIFIDINGEIFKDLFRRTSILVEFEREFYYGHDGKGKGKKDCCRWFHEVNSGDESAFSNIKLTGNQLELNF